jgi:hypothetical protein
MPLSPLLPNLCQFFPFFPNYAKPFCSCPAFANGNVGIFYEVFYLYT